ncbi:hypothetical protein [Devriesea agamarum]|uniref:hypothetical protein n=1 Tax=Devriesea agamarum TaxID=472569 RepID=UPI00071E3E87|nr:hypothetical protein [Devriesea agamarum]
MHGPDTWDYTDPSWTPRDADYPFTPQTFTLTIPLDLTITSNRAAQTWKRTKVKDAMRALTRVAARHLQSCSRATIWVGITKRTRRIYDPVNLSDTFKGCIDELVTMKILDEDNYNYVNGPWLWHEGVDTMIPDKHLRANVILDDYCRPVFPL